MSTDRYPGPRSFESNERAIFFGCTSEVNDLLNLIRQQQIIVLFSKSGLGKSSLLNAGVVPALSMFVYQPVRVRFQVAGNTPLISTIESLTIQQQEKSAPLTNTDPFGESTSRQALGNPETASLSERCRAGIHLRPV